MPKTIQPKTLRPATTEETTLFPTQKAWERWLARHHTTATGLWLRLGKKASPTPSVTYAEALEVALCFGWIDAHKRPESDLAWLQRFTPRSPRSIWSKINCAKAEALIAAGRMQPAGLAEIERARLDGRWAQAYDPPSTATPPPDFLAALAATPTAQAFYATLQRRNTYAILFRIQTAKKPETRARKIRDLVAMLERHEKIYP